MLQADPQPEHTASTFGEWWAASGWASLLMGGIIALAGVGAFTAVRTWYAPARGTGVVPATLSVGTQPPGAALVSDQQSRGRTLSVITDPPGARVVIDARFRGMSPVILNDLAAGEHTIVVASDAGSARRTVTVSNAVASEVVFSLPAPARGAATPGAGWLAVASPFPVDIVERGEVIGTSGTAKIMLPSGRHDVVLRNDAVGYSAPRTIEVVPGRVAPVTVTPPTGLLNVNATPWADVSIDGRPAGQTPLGNVEIAIGPHQITFRHPQFGERTRQVVVAAQGVNRVAVDLSK